MVLYRLSLKKLLLFSSFGVVAVLLAILLTTNFSIKSSISNYTTLSQMDELTECALRLKKNEKDFVMLDTKSPQFFLSGQSRSTVQFDSTFLRTKKLLEGLKRNNVFSTDELQGNLTQMETGLNGYGKAFKELVALHRELGFKDEGVIGKMRGAIHEVENELNTESSFELISEMLMLRRHEKDYMLRKDTAYISKFDGQMGTMLSKVTSPTMISLLYTYKKYFEEYVTLDQKIGLNENSGVNAAVTRNSAAFESALNSARAVVKDKEQSSTNESLFVLFAVIILLSGLVIIVLYVSSNHILKSIKKLQNYILRLGKGELPEKITVMGKDEVAQMEDSLNELITALRNTRDFAIEVGNGNFEADINVFSNSGEVGESLQEMRKKLSQVAVERTVQAEENQKRLWINEGITLVNDIVNKGKDDIEELCYEFITGVVKYAGLNQAGIMLEEVDEDENPYLKMVATYAFNRRKFYQKRVEIGDGLAGMCFWEKEMIYITDVPKDYSSISSALGEASPKCVIILPLLVDNIAIGVIEMASFKVFERIEIEFFERSVGILAARLLGLRTSVATSKLLEQTKLQAQEMAAQEEELRQNLEELHATQESLMVREDEMREQMHLFQEQMEQERAEANRERANYLERLAVHKRTMDAFGAAFLLAEFDLKGNLEWANGKFLQTFGVDHDFMESFNMLLCDHTIDKTQELQRWDMLRKGEPFIGEVTICNGTLLVTLLANYQPVMGVETKGGHVFYSAATIATSQNVSLVVESESTMLDIAVN
ncbi:HAMP domain-containing protein [Alistipes sp. ZOR0009]|uniref:HAMP domain-containing protein n=1 Tax=Alistipes sp. ZOR0009 TaxID=1339253 RepID=UPI0006900FA9|nr:HAMP domain-containing protein [Alistipes sp. ZOR0009]